MSRPILLQYRRGLRLRVLQTIEFWAIIVQSLFKPLLENRIHLQEWFCAALRSIRVDRQAYFSALPRLFCHHVTVNRDVTVDLPSRPWDSNSATLSHFLLQINAFLDLSSVVDLSFAFDFVNKVFDLILVKQVNSLLQKVTHLLVLDNCLLSYTLLAILLNGILTILIGSPNGLLLRVQLIVLHLICCKPPQQNSICMIHDFGCPLMVIGIVQVTPWSSRASGLTLDILFLFLSLVVLINHPVEVLYIWEWQIFKRLISLEVFFLLHQVILGRTVWLRLRIGRVTHYTLGVTNVNCSALGSRAFLRTILAHHESIQLRVPSHTDFCTLLRSKSRQSRRKSCTCIQCRHSRFRRPKAILSLIVYLS